MTEIRDAGVRATPEPGDLVILRESEAGDDLAAAIRRVRAEQATQRSRILVIARDDHDPEPAAPARAAAPFRDVIARGRLAAQVEALTAVGQRLQPLAADLRNLLGEAIRALAELDEDLDAGPRAALRNRVRDAGGILEWVGAVCEDLEQEADSCAAGRQPVDLADLLGAVVRAVEADMPGLRVAAAPASGSGRRPCLDPGTAAEMLAAALRLVAERIGGTGTVEATVEYRREVALVCLAGAGEPRRLRGGERAVALRRLAARAGARLRPYPSGIPGIRATGLELAFRVPR